MTKFKIDPITESGILLALLLMSAMCWKLGKTCLASNCTKVSTPCFSCERNALSEENALELINNQTHVNSEKLHEIVVDTIKKDIENQSS